MYTNRWTAAIADLFGKVIEEGERALDRRERRKRVERDENKRASRRTAAQFDELLDEAGRGADLTGLYREAVSRADAAVDELDEAHDSAEWCTDLFSQAFCDLEAAVKDDKELRADLAAAAHHVFQPHFEARDAHRSIEYRLRNLLDFLRKLKDDESYRRNRDELWELAKQYDFDRYGKPNDELGRIIESWQLAELFRRDHEKAGGDHANES